jgi:predicted small lipoprotein YifL
MKIILAVLLIALSLAACGVRGDPEPPPANSEETQ